MVALASQLVEPDRSAWGVKRSDVRFRWLTPSSGIPTHAVVSGVPCVEFVVLYLVVVLASQLAEHVRSAWWTERSIRFLFAG